MISKTILPLNPDHYIDNTIQQIMKNFDSLHSLFYILTTFYFFDFKFSPFIFLKVFLIFEKLFRGLQIMLIEKKSVGQNYPKKYLHFFLSDLQ